MEFAELKLNRQLLDAVAAKGYTEATPIQEQAIPRVLAGQDVVAIAQTGTGKTAAYLLPLLMKLKFAQGDHPRALILAPTRELALQIAGETQELAANTDLRMACIYGGKGIKRQVAEVRAGTDILIGTPGRIMDVYLQSGIYLRQLQVLVLDEADKMMDMGFMPQIRRLLEVVPAKRQNLLFSATFPPKVEKLSQEFLDFPEWIEVTPSATPAETVSQALYYVPNFRTKLNLLSHLLEDEEHFERIMVFTRTRQSANLISKYLQRQVKGETRVIHANKDQNNRLNTMQAFRDGELRILVATDVVSRGIDVSLVSHVVNFDVPLIYEDYVHRIGRTGRAENTGSAVTFCNDAEKYHIKKIEAIIGMKIPVEELPMSIDIAETPFEERQSIAREIDDQRKRENPNFQGAFHEKKEYKPKPTAKTSAKKKQGRGFWVKSGRSGSKAAKKRR